MRADLAFRHGGPVRLLTETTFRGEPRLAVGAKLRDNAGPTILWPTTMPAKRLPVTPCPCGQPLSYADCCGAYHAGAAAPTAEALMRSRYSAYVLGLDSYLRATWHATTRPAEATPLTDATTRWLGLSVKRFATTGAGSALVEFAARYRIGGRAQRLHETSRFVREDGRWYYVDGQFDDAPTPAER